MIREKSQNLSPQLQAFPEIYEFLFLPKFLITTQKSPFLISVNPNNFSSIDAARLKFGFLRQGIQK